MNRSEYEEVHWETRMRHIFLRLGCGLISLKESKGKRIVIIGYVVIAILLWMFRKQFYAGDRILMILQPLLDLILLALVIAILLIVIVLISTPINLRFVTNGLRRAGLTNHVGETPILLRQINIDQSAVVVMEFESNGIPKPAWEDSQLDIEAALNVYVVKIAEGKNKRRILLHVVPASSELPSMIEWNEPFLSSKNFELVMGESLLGQVIVNIARIPHILLGGSTGSGKSILLKMLLIQCVKKGAKVYIADFKGGVDFSRVWEEYCTLIINEDALLEVLGQIVEELENRKTLLRNFGCSNIDEYNKKLESKLQRIVFACDEVAEILDKTGQNKDGKDRISSYENKLATIARQGRAFGIHLILATQRPDANILAGQIRNNIDYRVCGRADNVLSQIILDNTSAADAIDKDAQGRFINAEGTVFQGYFFDEGTVFGTDAPPEQRRQNER